MHEKIDEAKGSQPYPRFERTMSTVRTSKGIMLHTNYGKAKTKQQPCLRDYGARKRVI